jgi:hypothetical protein
MSRRAQWLAALILGGVWAGVALWVWGSATEPQRAPLTHVTGKVAQGKGRRSPAVVGLTVRLDLLAAARRRVEEALVSPKNIFAPLQVDDPERARARLAPAPPPDPAVPPPPSPEELAAQAAGQELAQFRYLGYLIRSDGEEAFLSKGKALHIVRSGDTIEQRVLVKAVTPAGVTLQEPKSQVERTVLLVESR